LLHPAAIERAIRKRMEDRTSPTAETATFSENVSSLLMLLADGLKNQVQARLVSSRQQFERTTRSSLDAVTVSEAAMNDFDEKWATTEGRMKMVPGKELLSALNAHLQRTQKIALSPLLVVESFSRAEICPQLAQLLRKLDELRKEEVPDQPSFEFASQPA
jgi:hypothetical protein